MVIPLQGVLHLTLLAFFLIALFSTLGVDATGKPPLGTHVNHKTPGGRMIPRMHPNRAPGRRPKFKPGPWRKANATFYEGTSGSYGGACAYEDVQKQGFGEDTAALSSVLYLNGQSCGACYEIQCLNSQWCKKGKMSIFVSGTNYCPPGGCCSPPHEHFDLAKSSFLKIADYKGGIVPVTYRRVPCKKKGGIKFKLTGNPYFNEVQVWNVGGSGDVTSLQVKGSTRLKWTHMKREWGQKWVSTVNMTGKALTFRVETSDGKVSTSWSVCPKNWQFGQTYEGKNFL